jgi:hypothetical protein
MSGRYSGWGLARLAVAATSVAAVELIGYYIFYSVRFLGGDLQGPDFFHFYAAAHQYLAAGGASMYDFSVQSRYQSQVTAMWHGSFVLLPYVHPPYYTPLLLTVAWLPYRQAYLAWAALNVILLSASLYLLIGRSLVLRGRAALLAALLGAAFLPVYVVVLQGQSDAFMLLALTGAYLVWARGHRGWAGVLSGLALIKPQMMLLVPVLFLARRSWRGLAGVGGGGAGLAVVSLLSAGPGGVRGYLEVVFSWVLGRTPGLPITNQTVYSLRGLLEVMPGGHLPAIAVLVLLLALVGLSLSWRPDVPRLDFALAIAASVVLSPYQNLHDLSLLLIPGIAVADLALSGNLRWPALGLALVAVGSVGVSASLIAGSGLAAAAALALALYLVAERLAVRPEPIPLPDLAWSGERPSRVIVLPAYRAARTLKEVIDGIPPGSADRILLVDDASADATVSVATALRLDVIVHERNLGYGGNQKTCYQQALAMGADVVVMLHPDNQYDPAIVPKLCEVIEAGVADLVLGSRWLGLDPAAAGMPWWKRLGNRGLTALENRVLGLSLSEFHTGYRAYSRRFLEAVPFLENSNDFVFDTQVLIQAANFGFRIGEVAAVGRYFEEASSVNFRTSSVYGLKTLAALLRYVLHRAGFRSVWLETAREPAPAPLGVARPVGDH